MTDDHTNADPGANAPPRWPGPLPGPLQIDAGAVPDGLVIHAYAVPSGRLLVCREISAPANLVDAQAYDDATAALAALAPGEAIVLVAYDGDTGDRIVWPS